MSGIDLLARTLMALAVAVLLAWAAVAGSPTVWVQPDYSRPVAVTGTGDAPRTSAPQEDTSNPRVAGVGCGSLSPVPIRVPGLWFPTFPGPGTHPARSNAPTGRRHQENS